MAAKRLTRKQLLKEPDEFITLTGRTIEWVKTHTKQVVTGVSIFITAVLLVAGYRYYEEQRARAASNLFSKALETYQQQVEEKDQAKVMEEIRPEFDKLVETYHSQAAGRLGQILYGHILLNADKPEAAVDMFKKAWDDYGDDPVLANIILNGLSVAYLRIGDKEAAMAQMEKIVAGSATTHKDAALFRLGLLYLESDQKDKGRDLFKKLSEEFPNSMYVEMAKEQASG